MALTVRRWVIGACLGCAVLALSLWPITDYRREIWWMTNTGASAADIARWNLNETGEAWALLVRRDSLLQSSRTAPPRDVSVVFDTMVPTPTRPALTKAIRRALTADSSRGPDMKVVVFVSRRTSIRLDRERTDVASLGDTWYFLPAATDGRTCLVLAYQEEAELRSLVEAGDEANREEWAEHTVAPCAWYRDFGPAGPRVEQWLRSAGYLYAGRLDRGGSRARLGEHGIKQDAEPDIGELLGLVFGRVSEFEVPTEVRACAHHDLDICRAILHWRHRRSRFGPLASVARQTGGYERHELTWFLADLHREIGAARFKRFWTSPAPIDSAFREATGSSLELWTQRWLLGRIARPQFGPTPTTSGLTLGGGLLVLLLGIGTAFAMRRQVA